MGEETWERTVLRAMVCQYSDAVCGCSFPVKWSIPSFLTVASSSTEASDYFLPHWVKTFLVNDFLSPWNLQLLPLPISSFSSESIATTNSLSSKPSGPPSCGGRCWTLPPLVMVVLVLATPFLSLQSFLFSFFLCHGVPLGSLLTPHLLICSSVHIASITISSGLNSVPQKFIC